MKTFILFFLLFSWPAQAITMGQETRTAFYIDINGNQSVYDPNNPPSPIPSIDQIYITVAWQGIASFNVPARWSQNQINKTIQSEMDRFNNPPDVNGQVQGGLTP